ncbi:chemotaxis protein CheW [Burkholderia ubonensis]|uniref:chemotaxis protein CheW n=1 Tax=Burkholderia ubonensis TaxID=101571 RepID=UPI00075DAD69|nr:chemotaxis protein CheW [Burkholderia ubonensis]KWB79386.1 chemotaxis protein CheW [Burkholderia ubonensis]
MEPTDVQRETLIFRLGDEEYGVDILKVQEIRGWDEPTKIANAPNFVKGVINLRGLIVPIIDLRIKFGLGNVAYDKLTVVVILNVANRTVGVVVDGVSDVVVFDANHVRPAPEFGAAVDAAFIDGLGMLDERMVIFLDIERLVISKELSLFSL